MPCPNTLRNIPNVLHKRSIFNIIEDSRSIIPFPWCVNAVAGKAAQMVPFFICQMEGDGISRACKRELDAVSRELQSHPGVECCISFVLPVEISSRKADLT